VGKNTGAKRQRLKKTKRKVEKDFGIRGEMQRGETFTLEIRKEKGGTSQGDTNHEKSRSLAYCGDEEKNERASEECELTRRKLCRWKTKKRAGDIRSRFTEG